MALSFSKDKFLSNDTNKQNIINLIGKILQIAGYNVVFSQEDADVDIALAAIKESHYQNVTVVGEDTDLLILLLYYYSKQSDFQLLFQSDKHAKPKDVIKLIFIATCWGRIYVEHYYFCIILLVAIQPQDFMESENQLVLNYFLNNPRLLQLASIFLKPDQRSDDYLSCNDDFGMLRKQILAKEITPSKSFVEPKHLPPTKHSLKYHSCRAYFQILKCLNIPGIKAEYCGWKTVNNSGLLQFLRSTFPAFLLESGRFSSIFIIERLLFTSTKVKNPY